MNNADAIVAAAKAELRVITSLRRQLDKDEKRFTNVLVEMGVNQDQPHKRASRSRVGAVGIRRGAYLEKIVAQLESDLGVNAYEEQSFDPWVRAARYESVPDKLVHNCLYAAAKTGWTSRHGRTITSNGRGRYQLHKPA